MTPLKQKIALGLTACTLLSPAAGMADQCCWDPCECGRFQIGADFLWWKPCTDDLEFASIYTQEACGNDTLLHIKYKSIDPDWEPGVRVRAAMHDVGGGLSISGSYTYMKSDDKRTVTLGDCDGEASNVTSPLLHGAFTSIEPMIEPSGARFRIARGDWEAEYHHWDVLFAYPLQCNPCHTLTPYFGVAGVVLDQKLRVNLLNEVPCQPDPCDPCAPVTPTYIDYVPNRGSSAHISWKSDFWGVGLKVGAHYAYKLGDCFEIFGNASGSILAGENDGKHDQCFRVDQNAPAINVSFRNDKNKSCHLLPGYHLQAGVAYTGNWCDVDVAARIGYEFVEWRNAPNHRVFNGDNADKEGSHSTSSNTRTFGFHGLFAGLDFVF